MLLRVLLPLLLFLNFSCRTVKKSTTEEIHREESIKGIKYDSVSTSKDKTISISDVKEVKKSDFEIEITIDSTVKWDSMWVPKTPLDLLNKIVHTPKTNIKIKGNINSAKDSKTTTLNDKLDSIQVNKEDSSKTKKEDIKNTLQVNKKGMSFGLIIWGILIIIIIAALLIINYYFPFFSKIKKIFNKNA